MEYKGWRQIHQYEIQWAAEGFFSSIKRIFGETVREASPLCDTAYTATKSNRKEWYLMATTLVDKNLGTRCKICSIVCPTAIVSPANENTLPVVQEAVAGMCLQRRHCEVFCPSQALLLDVRPYERLPLQAGACSISPNDLGLYLKKRQLVWHFTRDPAPKKIERILDIARYAASGATGNRFSGSLGRPSNR